MLGPCSLGKRQRAHSSSRRLVYEIHTQHGGNRGIRSAKKKDEPIVFCRIVCNSYRVRNN